jgi:hypothetical protein
MDSQVLVADLLRTEAEFPKLMNLARHRHDAFRGEILSFSEELLGHMKTMEESLL